MRHLAEPRQCVNHGGIPDARDLHAGLLILQINRALPEVYQQICQHSAPFV